MNEQAVRYSPRLLTALSQYWELAKPGIVGLTLVAAVTGVYFGNKGVWPQWDLIFWMLLTLGMVTAGSCMLNNVYDRDIDRLMQRTSDRPLAAGAASARHALTIGLLLLFPPLILMGVVLNTATALLTAAAAFGYVVVYTMMTKRHTSWANQLGGIAGALPPMIGYAAVTGTVDAPALVLFVIMVVWQQPHALSIALKYREEYIKAKVPVVPVAKGVRSTKWRILWYTLVLAPVSVLPYAYGMAGVVYLAAALALGLVFLTLALRFLWSTRDCDMRLFAYSIAYLIALFGVMLFDAQHGTVT